MPMLVRELPQRHPMRRRRGFEVPLPLRDGLHVRPLASGLSSADLGYVGRQTLLRPLHPDAQGDHRDARGQKPKSR
jgi:hypothetical protein